MYLKMLSAECHISTLPQCGQGWYYGLDDDASCSCCYQLISPWEMWQNSCLGTHCAIVLFHHDDIIKWKHFPHYWPFVRGIRQSSMNPPHKGQWCRALMFSLIYAWTNGLVNNRDTSDLRCHRTHYDIIVMTHRTSLMRSQHWFR